MTDHELFLKALHNAIAWQNRCVELYEILELVCLESEAAQAHGIKGADHV